MAGATEAGSNVVADAAAVPAVGNGADLGAVGVAVGVRSDRVEPVLQAVLEGGTVELPLADVGPTEGDDGLAAGGIGPVGARAHAPADATFVEDVTPRTRHRQKSCELFCCASFCSCWSTSVILSAMAAYSTHMAA